MSADRRRTPPERLHACIIFMVLTRGAVRFGVHLCGHAIKGRANGERTDGLTDVRSGEDERKKERESLNGRRGT